MAGYVLDTWILHKLGLSEVNVAIDNVSPIPSCFIWLALRLCPSALNIMEPPLFQHWSARLNTWAGDLCSWFMAHVQVFQWSQIWYRYPFPTCASSIMFQLISLNLHWWPSGVMDYGVDFYDEGTWFEAHFCPNQNISHHARSFRSTSNSRQRTRWKLKNVFYLCQNALCVI